MVYGQKNATCFDNQQDKKNETKQKDGFWLNYKKNEIRND